MRPVCVALPCRGVSQGRARRDGRRAAGSRRTVLSKDSTRLISTEFHFQQIPFDTEQLSFAQKAWLVYGRGRHKAKLNFGDCASYGLAQAKGEPLLFIGLDFSQTDVPAVHYS